MGRAVQAAVVRQSGGGQGFPHLSEPVLGGTDTPPSPPRPCGEGGGADVESIMGDSAVGDGGLSGILGWNLNDGGTGHRAANSCDSNQRLG